MKLFFSHSSRDKALVREIKRALEDWVEVWLDEIDLLVGKNLKTSIEVAIRQQADYVVVFLTADAIRSPWVQQELQWAAENEAEIGREFILPVLAEDVDNDLPEAIRDRVYLKCIDQSAAGVGSFVDRLMHHLFKWLTKMYDDAKESPHVGPRQPSEPLNTPPRRHGCILTVDELNDPTKQERLPNENFVIELLTDPVKIERSSSGQVLVKIDRTNVKNVAVCNEGQLEVTRQCVTPEKVAGLRDLDWKIQSFLNGTKTDNSPKLDLAELGICLRWASGGVLSIVQIVDDADPTKQWVPLFFRDIRPYGWNISLGQTERWFTHDNLLHPDFSPKDEPNEPFRFILREFLEETLIGRLEEGKLTVRNFDFGNVELPIPVTRAAEFSEEHRRLREREDNLKIVELEDDAIPVTFLERGSTLAVTSHTGGLVKTKHVIVCFSLLDLGIEVVKVANYSIRSTDLLLDGEILVKDDPETGTTTKELVRMPIALVSLDYLKRTFHNNDQWQRYTFGPQPSVLVPKPPASDEIKVFDFDVKRRMELLRKGEKRCVDWYDRFGRHFIRERKAPGKWRTFYKNPSPLFVPGTAKILNLYFSMF